MHNPKIKIHKLLWLIYFLLKFNTLLCIKKTQRETILIFLNWIFHWLYYRIISYNVISLNFDLKRKFKFERKKIYQRLIVKAKRKRINGRKCRERDMNCFWNDREMRCKRNRLDFNRLRCILCRSKSGFLAPLSGSEKRPWLSHLEGLRSATRLLRFSLL